MKVLMLSNMYPSASEPGYGSFVQRQKRELTERFGVQIELVSTSRRGGGLRNIPKYALLLAKTIAATVRGGYDVVHAHYLLPVAAFALIPSVVRGKPLVITAHGTDIFSGQRKPWKRYITRALNRACRIIVVSEYLADRLTENYRIAYGPGREYVIANMGVDTDLFTPGDATALKVAAGVPADVPHLLFVGNFVEQKGVSDLARALVLLRDRGIDFRATLLGHGPEMADVRQIVAPLGDMVRFKTVVSHEILVDVFRSADLFVLPSRREGVGLLVCLESLSCGVPVVCSSAGGLPEIVVPGMNGALFEPGDPIALADAIQRLLADPLERARLAGNARASALPYSETTQAEKVFRVYEECAGQR